MSTPGQWDLQWRKSSRSGGQGGNCVELADATPMIVVRDSKNPDGPRLAFGRVAWRVFAEQVKASKYDLEG
ncbi:DUF397 domain-containing protein [Actinomadura sp. 3N508]|uniref:DUF397 domain-containing protein n=1 Tax=Actinomadura sp. 3N508 TaxID=3375153 RepID=UPI0037BAC660